MADLRPRALPPRAKTTSDLPTLNTLLTPEEAAAATIRPPPRGPFLLNWQDIHPWQQDNHYILTSYRPSTGSYTACLQSLFYLHNESVNIHSHLSGCFLFTFIGLFVLLFESKNVRLADVLVFSCFFVGAGACLGMSATYHLISNHSAEVARWGNQLDYVGIVLLTTGSFVPSVYYGFFCEPGLQWRYWSMNILGHEFRLSCTIVSINPKFRTPSWRPFRAAMFVAMGLSAVFPVLHGVSIYGVAQMLDSIGLFWLVLQGFLYVSGAGLYAITARQQVNRQRDASAQGPQGLRGPQGAQSEDKSLGIKVRNQPGEGPK
ncbi:MAG: hypothetical protein OHK93_004829 [Ramalina farinacea]|uniref:Adiponectin receptor 2 n=1 Tax=Ramalina farinacea TaxID=258253 RepID=A0AA43QUY3_9LECA|nr:hypothetical protein [Ramalina farinacea]